MIKFRTPLNNFLGRIRYGLANFRRWCLNVCALTPGHWTWAAQAILLIMGLFMLGMALDFFEAMNIWIFLGALAFFVGLALLSGLGVRLGLKLLNLLPEKQSWLFFGGVFFIFFFFGFPTKAMILLVLFLILSGSFLGAGLRNLSGGRWMVLSKVRKVLTLVFVGLGTGIFVLGWFFMLYPGKGSEEVKLWSMEVPILPSHLEVDDPSLPGPFAIDSLTYGWGKDKPRKEYGSGAELITEPVDGSSFLDGWEKFSGKMRTAYWKMSPDSLALNATVWYPLGEGPFPLVLMVHGNHLDRDFSDPGYDYLGRHFASHGFIAASVDENFLNGGWYDMFSHLETENDCRGWLLLKHLEQWRAWNTCDSSRFFQQVDMDRIVLIGHSRGGEAVSIASCFNTLPCYPDNAKELFDFNFAIKGIVAIAPVDGQYWPGGIATPVDNVNYFTIQGSMDADLRSYDGLRQMRRVGFRDSSYHFAAGLYLHGANHGQFNRSWGIFDTGYPRSLFVNRKAIIPVEQQEKVALVYLTAFVLESLEPGSGYLSLFKDYRSGRDWLPDLVHLSQFHESSARILCDYEEDLDLLTGSWGIDSICADSMALWKEGRIPKKWGNQRNNGVFLGWNNEKDSLPGYYRIVLNTDAFEAAEDLDDFRYLSFLAADAQIDPGERTDSTDLDADEDEEKAADGNTDEKANGAADELAEDEEEPGEEEDPVPVDFSIVLSDTLGREYPVKLGDYHVLQPALKPMVFKSRLFWEDPESEVVLQYVAIPLEAFKNKEVRAISAGAIRSISFVFDAEKKGTVLLDQIGFSR
jgi:Cutinase